MLENIQLVVQVIAELVRMGNGAHKVEGHLVKRTVEQATTAQEV